MARRRDTSLLGLIFELYGMLPWQVGVATGFVVFLGMRFILPLMFGDDQSGKMWKTMFCNGPIPYAIGGIFVIAGIVSLIKNAGRRQLFQSQKSLASIRDLSWRDFETYISEAFRQQGYDVEETGGGGADGGIDLVLRNEHETVLVQCKQWRNERVSVNIVREMYGLVHAKGAERGIIVTSGDFTPDAREFASDKPIELLNGRHLEKMVFGTKAEMEQAARSGARMVAGAQKRQLRQPDADSTANPAPKASAAMPVSGPTLATAKPAVSLATAATPACPACHAPMVVRTAKNGVNTGNQFYGCSRYPRCKGIVQVAK